MREILFRGKRTTDGEWCEGNLFIDEKGEKHEILLGYTNYRIAWEVIPSTIGQYTGLTDKNGKKIFEGDILYDEHNESNCLITFDEGSFCILDDNVSQSAWGCSMNGFEVIGNLHDNPELLRS